MKTGRLVRLRCFYFLRALDSTALNNRFFNPCLFVGTAYQQMSTVVQELPQSVFLNKYMIIFDNLPDGNHPLDRVTKCVKSDMEPHSFGCFHILLYLNNRCGQFMDSTVSLVIVQLTQHLDEDFFYALNTVEDAALDYLRLDPRCLPGKKLVADFFPIVPQTKVIVASVQIRNLHPVSCYLGIFFCYF